jgi:nucleoside-diphosphate-sugar epimerase
MATLIVGFGYLGRRIGRLLAAKGEHVYGTTRSATIARELPAWGVEPVVADVLDRDSLRRLPEAERVVYCVGFDRRSGLSIRAVTVLGLRDVLHSLGDRTERLVYVSSTGVYGQTDGGWVDEESPTDPGNSTSGQNALEGEGSVLTWGRETGRSVSVVRFSGLYGPGRVIGRGRLSIKGDADHYLNLIQIVDAARAAVAVLEHGTAGRNYLATDDRPVTRREYYSLAARLLGTPEPMFETDYLSQFEPNKRVSNRRLRRELGVTMTYPDITTGLPAALEAERGVAGGG